MPVLNNISSDLTLVLTASVNPKSMPGVTRADPRDRERDYADALRYYVTQHTSLRRIVFIENSGWPLETIRRAVEGDDGGGGSRNPHGKEIEFLSLDCNDFPRHRGKSYGEMLLMDEGLARSRLAAGSKFVAKITGRNYLMNLSKLLGTMCGRDFDMWVDLHDHGIYEALRLNACGRHAESRFFVFTPAFYDRWFRGTYEKMDDSIGYTVEKVVFDVAKLPELEPRVRRRFLVEPDFRGLAGHLGKDYSSPRQRLRRQIRGTARRLMPWLHL